MAFHINGEKTYYSTHQVLGLLVAIWKFMHLNPYIIPYTEMGSGWIKCLHVKNEHKVIEKIDNIFNHLGMRKTLLGVTQ